jgi:DNA-binding NtrC family response regulator
MGEFRNDLYHRLCSVEVLLPPLRERPADIPLLVRTFVDEAQREHGPLAIDDETLAALTLHPWPGNVRELRNAVRRAAVLGEGHLRLRDLVPPAFRPVVLRASEGAPDAPAVKLDDVTRSLMERALDRCGSYRRAAAAIGMSKSSFHDRARRFGLAASVRSAK